MSSKFASASELKQIFELMMHIKLKKKSKVGVLWMRLIEGTGKQKDIGKYN